MDVEASSTAPADRLDQLNQSAQLDQMELAVQANLTRFQNPVFAALARALEASVPPATGFGRFRGRD